ncbi:5-methyltetrahydrofolate corrinoid/iron sulfur protein methyltransferase [Thermoflexales bacterium]|nr:5-methyltetrahydrofolate corrinoid/iron sulfur protein methyltransferase [Thermoflexales bacterium]
MKIIGEKINGTRKTVAAAIAQRDAEFIQNLAKKQVEGGAHWLDVNAGTHPDREVDDLLWLIDLIQGVTDVPLSLDSANPAALTAAIGKVKKTPLINSISGEPDRLNNVLPIVAQYGCEVIALAMDDKGIPNDAAGRLAVVRKLFETTRTAGIPDEKVYVDALVMTIATNTDAGRATLDTIRAVRAEFPQAHVSLGLSNVSFGLPVRSLVNRTFLTLAIAAGMDTAIIDPNDRELKAALLATDLLLGQDKHCLNYTRAFRKGLLEPNKQPA